MDLDDGPFILTLSPGMDMNCIQIPIFEDDLPEGDELFIVAVAAIGQDASRVLVSVPTALVTIEDNDAPGKNAAVPCTHLLCSCTQIQLPSRCTIFCCAAPQVIISLEFGTYTAEESDTMVEVCVTIGSADLPPGSVAQYRLETGDRSAIGMSMFVHEQIILNT